MQVSFTKMHGLGNDFMVVDATHQPFSLAPSQIQHLAHRHLGVGFDQLLVIEPARNNTMDFYYRIFNVDGKEAEQCGNGLRCIVKYILDKGLAKSLNITIGTQKGLHDAQRLSSGLVQVNLGPAHTVQGLVELSLGQTTAHCFVLNLGNPHAVIQVEDLSAAPVQEWGKLANQHAYFPTGINLGFMQWVSADRILLRVFERGVGETLACGSGACAAVMAGFLQGILSSEVNVSLPGGDLTIKIQAEELILIGPAVTVYEGVVVV